MRINKVFLFYPPGPQYQRGEDRSQGNVDQSTATSMRAPNDMGYVSSQLDQKNIKSIFTDYASEGKTAADLYKDFVNFSALPYLIIVKNSDNSKIFLQFYLIVLLHV